MSNPDAKLGEERATVASDDGELLPAAGQPKTKLELAQEQRQWNEDRIRRRLMNEYERAGKALGEVVSSNLDAPLRLSSIRITGTRHTRPSFLGRIASPYLSSPTVSATSQGADALPSPETLRDVLRKTRDITDHLNKLDIFSEVEAGLESSTDVFAGPEDVDLVLKVKEASRYFLRTATDVGDGEGNATATARVRNALGGAETLEGNASFGTRTKSSFNVRLSTPLFADPTTQLSLNGFAIERDLSHFASCRERLRGAKLSVKTLSIFGDHEFAYDSILRNICEVGPSASMSIRNASGLSVKSALSHTFLRDTRDDPFISTQGSYLRLLQEYAGLGGDAAFVKLEGESQVARPLGHTGCTVSLSTRGGLLYPLSEGGSKLPDRFQLGGPTSVRMFKMSGLGPKDQNDHLGGDLVWAAGLSLITPIPKRPEWPLKGHFFVNAGRLVGFNNDLSTSFAQLVKQPAVSAGLGLMYRHSIVRLEFNVGMPIAAHKGDGVRKGFQVGLGLHFL